MNLKRLLPVLLLAAFLAACSGGALHTAPLLIEEPAAEEDTVSYQLRMERWEGDDETASYSYQVPVLSAYDRNGEALTAESAEGEEECRAVQAAETFNSAFREWVDGADYPGLAAMAKECYESYRETGQQWPGPFHQSLECKVYRTDRLISVSGNFYMFSGGAHPNTVLLGWNFDLKTGSFFFADQLVASPEAVTEVLREQLAERNVQCWDDCETQLTAWSDAAVTFHSAGMTVAYSPYDIASYAEGAQIFCIPMTWLEPHLSDYGRELLLDAV